MPPDARATGFFLPNSGSTPFAQLSLYFATVVCNALASMPIVFASSSRFALFAITGLPSFEMLYHLSISLSDATSLSSRLFATYARYASSSIKRYRILSLCATVASVCAASVPVSFTTRTPFVFTYIVPCPLEAAVEDAVAARALPGVVSTPCA